MVKRKRREPSVFEAYFSVGALLALVGIGNGVFKFDLKTMLVLAAGIFLIIAFLCGATWDEINKGIVDKIAFMGSLFIILLGIGFLIASLIVSGTVPVLVSYLAALISPRYCLVLSFLITSVISFVTGSSFCTMGTVGVILFQVAVMQGTDIGIAAAAVICGSWIGNYSSPVSDIINCLALDYEMSTMSLMKELVQPYGLAMIITTVWFYVLGMGSESTSGSTEAMGQVFSFIDEVQSNFNMSPVLLFPILLVIVLSALKIPTIIVLFGTGMISLFMGVAFQGYSVGDVLGAGFSGFSSDVFLPGVQLSEEMSMMINRGGMISMGDSLVFMFCILTCIGIMDVIGVFKVIDRTVFAYARTPVKLTWVTMFMSMLFGAVTGNDFATIILSRDLFADPYRKAGVELKGAAIITLTGVIISTMCLPWSFCADYSANIYGVRVFEYVPYSLWFLILPVMVLVFRFIEMRKRKKER